MELEQIIENYFLKRPFKEAYFKYLGADNKIFKERIIKTVSNQLKNPEGLLYFPADHSVIFYAQPNHFRSGILQVPFYNVPTSLSLEPGSFIRHWPSIQKKLRPGIYEVQKDFLLSGEWQEYIRAGGFSPGTAIKMVLRKNDVYPTQVLPDGLIIRPFNEEDGPAVRHIINEYQGNYLFQSPFLDKSRVTELFQEWPLYARDHLEGRLYVCSLNDNIIGILNCLPAGNFSHIIGKELGIVDFIMVKKEVQGKGYAHYLLQYAVEKIFPEAEFIELQTSLENFAAINFYICHKFKILESRVIIHMNISSEEGARSKW